jgi:hypothetical protein
VPDQVNQPGPDGAERQVPTTQPAENAALTVLLMGQDKKARSTRRCGEGKAPKTSPRVLPAPQGSGPPGVRS